VYAYYLGICTYFFQSKLYSTCCKDELKNSYFENILEVMWYQPPTTFSTLKLADSKHNFCCYFLKSSNHLHCAPKRPRRYEMLSRSLKVKLRGRRYSKKKNTKEFWARLSSNQQLIACNIHMFANKQTIQDYHRPTGYVNFRRQTRPYM